MAAKPPLGLIAEVTSASGVRSQWSLDRNAAGDIPANIRLANRLGDGFADAGCTLHRRIDRDYPDINLLDDFALIGFDGSIAYEGRIAANPRSIADVHSMDVQAAGHMALTRDRKVQINFVDRDFSHWGPPSIGRRMGLIASFGVQDFLTGSDDALQPSLITTGNGPWVSTSPPDCEAWYDARGLSIASLYYAWAKGSTVNAADANWTWLTKLTSDDAMTSNDNSGNLRATGPGTGTLTATTLARVYAVAQQFYGAAASTADNVNFPIFWTCLAVYGAHGLTKRGTNGATSAQGFYVSDMIDYVVSRVAPQLDRGGITATNYVVEHAAYLDPIDPFDIIADLNKYHRWIYGCEERKRFFYRPVDLTDYDWQVDYWQPGVSLNLQGDSTEGGVYNGIAVNFTSLQTGRPERLTPLDATYGATLSDADPDNPANSHNYPRVAEVTLSFPALPASAAQVGRLALAELNSPKGEGSITIKGHLKDRAGHWQQGWKPRAGDRVMITSSSAFSDRPRMISEVQWDHDSKTLTMTIESQPQLVDALFDRITTSLQAANLQ